MVFILRKSNGLPYSFSKISSKGPLRKPLVETLKNHLHQKMTIGA